MTTGECAPQPMATGTFARTPFCHLMLYLYEHRYSGTLAVLAPGQSETMHVRFRAGVADAMSTVRAASSMELSLMPLCGLVEGDYAFYLDRDLLSPAIPVLKGRVDPFPFLARALRTHACPAAVDRLLSRYRTVVVGVQPGVNLRRFAFRADELAFVETLEMGPSTPEALLAAAPIAPQRLKQLLYLLLITKVVVPRRPGVAAGSPVSHAAARPSNFPPTTSQPRNSILPQAGAYRAQASSPPAASEQQRAVMPAPHEQARHGDARATRPHAPVSHYPSQHPGVRTSVPPPVPLAMRHRRTPVSDVAPRRALIEADPVGHSVHMARLLADSGRYEEALELILPHMQRVLDARLYAMRAWILYLTSAAGGPFPAELEQSVRQALEIDPHQPRAIFVRGLQWLRYRRPLQAHRCFRQVCDLDEARLASEPDVRLGAEAELARIARGELA